MMMSEKISEIVSEEVTIELIKRYLTHINFNGLPEIVQQVRRLWIDKIKTELFSLIHVDDCEADETHLAMIKHITELYIAIMFGACS